MLHLEFACSVCNRSIPSYLLMAAVSVKECNMKRDSSKNK